MEYLHSQVYQFGKSFSVLQGSSGRASPADQVNELHREVTPLSSFDVPEVLSVHVVPSGDVRMVPDLPTVTKALLAQVTPLRYTHVPEVLSVQVIPSEEVRMVPFQPTVTKSPFPEVTPLRYTHVPEVLSAQVIPSGEVRIVPKNPKLPHYDYG